jgi:DnaJ domain
MNSLLWNTIGTSTVCSVGKKVKCRLQYPRCSFSSRSSSSSRKQGQLPTPTTAEDPFRVLGVSRGASYQTVKEQFLRLAKIHHPDIIQDKEKLDPTTTTNKESSANNKNDRSASSSFIRIRQAFEVIREGAHGEAKVVGNNEPQKWSEDELRDFMEEQTNQFLSFRMDHDTRQEVIKTFQQQQSLGGLDRGGSWLMARMLAERENCHFLETNTIHPPTKELSAIAESSSQRVQRRKRR